MCVSSGWGMKKLALGIPSWPITYFSDNNIFMKPPRSGTAWEWERDKALQHACRWWTSISCKWSSFIALSPRSPPPPLSVKPLNFPPWYVQCRTLEYSEDALQTSRLQGKTHFWCFHQQRPSWEAGWGLPQGGSLQLASSSVCAGFNWHSPYSV